MKLLEEVESFFGTKCLYEVLNVDKDSSDEQIRKAYRKASLKIHPDRVEEAEKKKATEKFQVLAQVHYVLSDKDRRKLYDDHGIIANDDSLESEADWENYWRLLFPKISTNDIQAFLDNYNGSKEEEEDLIKLYNRYKGDMDLIFETHISYDEERTTEQLNKLIEEGKIKSYSKFAKESDSKKAKRTRRAKKEAKSAAKAHDNDSSMDQLTALIKKKSQNNFDSMIANLEAKYATDKKGVKRKRNNR